MRRWRTRDTWATFASFLLALALCLYYQTHAIVDGPIRSDAGQYVRLAVNLLEHHVLSSADPGTTPLLPESYRTPGYPLILALVIKLTGGNLQSFYVGALALQAVMTALTVVLVFRIGRNFLGFWPAFAASLLLAMWPLAVVQSSFLLTETSFGFFMMAGLWALCVAQARASVAWYFAAAALLAFAAVINPMFAPFPLVLAVAFVLRRQAAAAILLIAFIAVPWGLWQARSASLPAATEATSQGHRLAENILIGMSPDIKRYYNDRVSPEGEAVFADFHRLLDLRDQRPRAFYAEVWARLSQQPGKYLHWYFVEKPGDVWYWPVIQGFGGLYVYPTMRSPYETTGLFRLMAIACLVLSPVFVLLALAGASYGLLAWLGRRRPSLPLLVLSLLFWYFSLLYWVLAPDGRYVTPFRGCEFLLAAFAMERSVQWLRQRRAGWASQQNLVPGRAETIALESDL
ncbi:glycosyltransferase family 39 protein [Dyella sp. C9]|uniref:ArnT family glycosyltransferase n=1 Tax=Dyella sp. C9 TaxID=2202154 RepID=UPI000DEEB8E7|nr:glycosyltransferase family 39 protein [Dyella sp. C9]